MIPNRLAVVAAAFLLVLGGCGQASISKENAAGVIQSSPGFKRAKVAYVSRVIAIPADGIEEGTKAIREGQALDLTQIAAIDPVIAVLRARDQIGIEEFVSPVPSSIVLPPKRDTLDSAAKVDSVKRDSVKLDSARKVEQPLDSAVKKPPKPVKLGPTTSPPPVPPLAQIWVHTLRVTPRTNRPEMADLATDDGDDDGDAPRRTYGRRPVDRTLGWTLALGTREFIRVLVVAEHRATREEVAGNYVDVDFLWRWRPTRAGALFDADGAEFQSLPRDVQRAVQGDSLAIDGGTTHWSRATLFHAGTGWRVTKVDWAYGDDKPHEGW